MNALDILQYTRGYSRTIERNRPGHQWHPGRSD